MCYNEKPTERLIRLVFVGITKRWQLHFKNVVCLKISHHAAYIHVIVILMLICQPCKSVLHETKTALHDFGWIDELFSVTSLEVFICRIKERIHNPLLSASIIRRWRNKSVEDWRRCSLRTQWNILCPDKGMGRKPPYLVLFGVACTVFCGWNRGIWAK